MKKYLMMLAVLAMAMTTMAVEVEKKSPEPEVEFTAFDIKLTATFFDGTEKMQAVLISADHGEGALVALYEKGEISFQPVDEFYAEAEGRYAAAFLAIGFFNEEGALFTTYGKVGRNSFQTKGVGLLVGDVFFDGPAPYFTIGLRYNSKLSSQMNESEMELALAEYLSKKTKIDASDILEEIGMALEGLHSVDSVPDE